MDKNEYKKMLDTRRLVKDIADQKKSTVDAADVFSFLTGFNVRGKHPSLFR